MFDFAIDTEDRSTFYAELADAADALTAGESDAIANMANVSALIWQLVPRLNWAGFYRLVGPNSGNESDSELVLGPFQGKAACIRIPLGKGVCGTAAAEHATQLVDDVHSFAGHIACDAESRAELVVPVVTNGRLVAVLDLDSPEPGRFDAEDATGIERLVARIADRLG